MNWFECYGLIVVSNELFNELFSWFWKIVGKDNDFELWFCLNSEFELEILR
jgi:hypothetical protein